MEQIMRPLSWIGQLVEATTGMLESSRENLENFSEAKTRPHVLDSATVERAITCYTEQNDDTELFFKQCAYWRKQVPSAEQLAGIERIEKETRELHSSNTEILAILEEVRGKTIDAIFAKGDLELLLDMMSGRQPMPD